MHCIRVLELLFMGAFIRACLVGIFICAALYALYLFPHMTPRNVETIEFLQQPGESLNIIGVFCLGALLVGLTFAIRQHQSPQGLNEKL